MLSSSSYCRDTSTRLYLLCGLTNGFTNVSNDTCCMYSSQYFLSQKNTHCYRQGRHGMTIRQFRRPFFIDSMYIRIGLAETAETTDSLWLIFCCQSKCQVMVGMCHTKSWTKKQQMSLRINKSCSVCRLSWSLMISGGIKTDFVSKHSCHHKRTF